MRSQKVGDDFLEVAVRVRWEKAGEEGGCVDLGVWGRWRYKSGTIRISSFTRVDSNIQISDRTTPLHSILDSTTPS